MNTPAHLLLGAAVMGRKDAPHLMWAAMAGALLPDLSLHHDDGRAHFWPATNWIFESPFSYWDRRQGADWIGPVELALAAIVGGVILLRRPGLRLAGATAVLAMAEVMATSSWLFMLVAG